MALRFSSPAHKLSAAPAAPKRAAVVARAASNKDEPQYGAGTVFFGGKAYTEAEFNEAAASGKLALPERRTAPTPASTSGSVSFSDVMAFSGSGPELINGRLAQLGFVAAMAAEWASDEGVVKQVSEEPTGIAAVFLLFTAASLVPLLQGKKPEKFAFFTPAAEMLNGRAAMIGLAAMIVIEQLNGGRALF